MSTPSDKKRKKQKERSKAKALNKVTKQNSPSISDSERKFGKTQIAIIVFLTIAGALFVILSAK